MFNLLQKIGKALMTPIAVLPVAALLLRLGFGDIFDGQIALIMKSAGDAVFSNLDLLFGVGIAYGLAKKIMMVQQHSPERLAYSLPKQFTSVLTKMSIWVFL